MLARKPLEPLADSGTRPPRRATFDAADAAPAAASRRQVSDALDGVLARAVATRGAARGPILQRDVKSAAQALHDAKIKVSQATLNQWLRKTEGSGKDKVTMATKHGVSLANLAEIQEAVAKLGGGAPKRALPIVEEKKKKGKEEREAVRFPHDGKHQPMSGLVGRPKQLAEATAEKNAVALYKTNDAATVIAWETDAINHGLTLSDNFTIVYGFVDAVGADRGELTRFIRMEGHHHGHPIVEHDSSVTTAFNSYMQKEVDAATDNPDRMEVIKAFLTRVNVPHSRYGIRDEVKKKAGAV